MNCTNKVHCILSQHLEVLETYFLILLYFLLLTYQYVFLIIFFKFQLRIEISYVVCL